MDDATPDAGQTIVYTLTVSNAGPDDATGVVVTDALPSGVTYVSDDGSDAYSAGQWTVGTVVNGGSAILHITATISGTAGQTIDNSTSVVNDNADSNSDNNTSTATLTVNTPPPPPSSGGGGGSSGSCGVGFTFNPATRKCDPATPPGQVLGASTSTPQPQVLGETCGLYMNQHLKQGSPKNKPDQVTRLQEFLNKYGYGTFTPTGYFGPLTFAAVKAFQNAYANEILKPWNISLPTGLVYLTTIRQLNLVECPDLMPSLPLPTLIPWNLNPNAQ